MEMSRAWTSVIFMGVTPGFLNKVFEEVS